MADSDERGTGAPSGGKGRQITGWSLLVSVVLLVWFIAMCQNPRLRPAIPPTIESVASSAPAPTAPPESPIPAAEGTPVPAGGPLAGAPAAPMAASDPSHCVRHPADAGAPPAQIPDSHAD